MNSDQQSKRNGALDGGISRGKTPERESVIYGGLGMLMVAGVRSLSLEVSLVLGPETCLTCKTDITPGHLASLLSQQSHFPGSGEIMHGKTLCDWKSTVQSNAQTTERGCRSLRIKLGKFGLRLTSAGAVGNQPELRH